MACSEKRALKEGRTIVFADQSGFYLLPMVVRTYAPVGETPILHENFTRDHLSAMSGITLEGKLYMLEQDRSFKAEDVVRFLGHLMHQIPSRLLIIWDGLKAHRSRLVREHVDSTDGAVALAFLPPYAPELNPVEYLWAWLKRHALANFCPDGLVELAQTARNKLKSAQRRSSIIVACWKQAELF